VIGGIEVALLTAMAVGFLLGRVFDRRLPGLREQYEIVVNTGGSWELPWAFGAYTVLFACMVSPWLR